MRFWLLVVGILVALTTSARAQGVTTGAIAGTVTDSSSGEKLAGVSVTVADQTAITDGDGKYEFADIPAGRYQISATKPAYVMQTWGQSQPTAPPKPRLIPPAGESVRIRRTSTRRSGCPESAATT